MDFKTLSVLPLRGVVLFPHVLAHFDVGRDGSIEAINRAVKADNMIFVTAQKNAMDEVADTENIYEIGTVAIIRQVIKVAERGYRVILEGLYRAQAVEFVKRTIFRVNVRKFLSFRRTCHKLKIWQSFA